MAYDILKGKVNKYILTSTMSVYDYGTNLAESTFGPYTYPLQKESLEDVPYGEGKRLAEAALFSKTDLPSAAVRIPIVLGEEDYTERLLFHVRKIMNEEENGLPNPEATLNFISAEEAGDFLVWIAEQPFTGPINACSNGDIRLSKLMGLNEEITGKQAKPASKATDGNHSPYGIEKNWTMDHSKAKELGYQFSSLGEWLLKSSKRKPGILQEPSLVFVKRYVCTKYPIGKLRIFFFIQ